MDAERIEIKKAKEIVRTRRYKLSSEEVKEDIVRYLVTDPRTGEGILMWCVLSDGTIGIRYVNMLEKAMKEANVNRGIMITQGKYTHAAKTKAPSKGIELIPRSFPSFSLFKHLLVPVHEILSREEKEEILKKYKVKPYQLPKIKASDPGVRAIGAQPGDVIKITRDSYTAGKYVSYRYVIED